MNPVIVGIGLAVSAFILLIQIMLIISVLKIPAILAELKNLRCEQMIGNRNIVNALSTKKKESFGFESELN